MTNAPWWLDRPVWPPVEPAIERAVMVAMRSGDWGRYEAAASEELLTAILAWVGRRRGRLMASGSAAIEWALRSMRGGRTGLFEPGDRVAISAWDYPGVLRAVELCGATPVMVDVERQRPVMDVGSLRRVLQTTSVSMVVASHLFGIAADVEGIAAVCREFEVAWIEDACQVPAMLIDGQMAGSFGDVATLSFGGSKPLTAGSGGAMLTDDEGIAGRWSAMLDRPSDVSPMSSLQSAALLPQLASIHHWRDRRNATAAMIAERLPEIGLSTFLNRSGVTASHYKMAIRFDDADRCTGAIERAGRVGFALGRPFRSLDRVSSRRCEQPVAAVHAGRLAGTTALLDHRMLMVPAERWGDLWGGLREVLGGGGG